MRISVRVMEVATALTMAVVLAVGSAFRPAVARAQEPGGVDHSPRFLLAMEGRAAPVEVEVSRVPLLRRQVSLTLNNALLPDALKALKRAAGIELVYSPGVINSTKRVTLQAGHMTVAAILTDLLIDARVDVLLSGGKYVTLVPRRAGAAVPTGEIIGRVTDAKTGAAVASADVLLEKTRWRTTTDTNGRYRLADIDAGQYTLVSRRLGYAKASRLVTVREQRTDTADVALEPMAARLQELVTTATGRRRRLDIANDVTTINADSVMQAAPIRSLTDLLDTRVPGLTVQRTSGAPGDPARLRLRGASSALRSNDPIVFVDGVRVYAEQSAARSGNLAAVGRGYAAPSPIDYIDPNTIETIEVLKGPSAATLYGPDAANGVIVITTKKGRPGPTTWSASLEHGQTRMTGAYPDLVYRWGHSLYLGEPMRCTALQEIQRLCAGDSLPSFQILNDPDLTVLDHGHRTRGSLTVSGGTQALTYAVTGSYANEIGLVRLPGNEADNYRSLFGLAPPDWMQRPQSFKQWGASSNITARLGAQANVSLRTSFTRSEQQRSSLERQLSTLMSTYFDRISGLYYRGKTSDGASYAFTEVAKVIPDYYQRATDAATQFTNSIDFDYRPNPWLALDANAGLSVNQRADELYVPRGPNVGTTIAPDTVGSLASWHGSSVVSTVNVRANVLRPLGRGFQFRFAAGANYTGTSSNDIGGSSRDLPPGQIVPGSLGQDLSVRDNSDLTFGWYAEPSVGNSKINFTSGLRLDGGSNFGSSVGGLSLPKFPKLGFSYLMSDEPWFPLKDLVQSFRLRVAYGRASRQPGPKDQLRLYGTPVQITADSQSLTTVTLASLGNTEVRPERTAEFEGGFDADLWDSRIAVAVSGWRKTTDDMLLQVPVAPSVYGGEITIAKNIGVSRNTGVDLLISAQVVRSSLFTWRTGLQLSRRRDVLVRLAPGVEPFYSAPAGNAEDGGIRIAPGYPLFGRWTRPILGYADGNSNGVLEQSEVQVGDTAVYVGSTSPDYTAAISSTLSFWRGAVTVNANFSYEDGVSQRNETALALSPFTAAQQAAGRPLGEQLATLDVRSNGRTAFNWIQTVSTTRFHSLSVQYRAPLAVARLVGAQHLSVALQGANLGLWTNYRGLDPNVNAYATGNNLTDNGVLPQPRTWQVRMSATY